MIYTEVLTTLLVLGGTSINMTMGDPGEAVPIFKFNSNVEVGRAMSRHKDGAHVL